jgi:hypothetical protein
MLIRMILRVQHDLTSVDTGKYKVRVYVHLRCFPKKPQNKPIVPLAQEPVMSLVMAVRICLGEVGSTGQRDSYSSSTSEEALSCEAAVGFIKKLEELFDVLKQPVDAFFAVTRRRLLIAEEYDVIARSGVRNSKGDLMFLECSPHQGTLQTQLMTMVRSPCLPCFVHFCSLLSIALYRSSSTYHIPVSVFMRRQNVAQGLRLSNGKAVFTPAKRIN